MGRSRSKSPNIHREWLLIIIICFHTLYFSFLLYGEYQFLKQFQDEFSQDTDPNDAFIYAIPTYAVYLTGFIFLAYFVIKKCCIGFEERVDGGGHTNHVATGWKQYLAYKAVDIILWVSSASFHYLFIVIYKNYLSVSNIHHFPFMYQERKLDFYLW